MELKLFFNNLKANIDHYDNVKAIEIKVVVLFSLLVTASVVFLFMKP